MEGKKTRTEKMSDIQRKLEEGVRDIFSSEQFKKYITTMSKFPHYSVNNCILIASQKPDASYVCGFHKWKEMGRFVNKGEHGIMIMAPIRLKADMAEEEVMPDGTKKTRTVTREFSSFKPVYVYDLSQTDGDPLPEVVNILDSKVEEYEQIKEALIKSSPVPVSFESIAGGANGYFSPAERRIVVKDDLPQLQTIKTMIHEISHATLGHGGKDDQWDRETKEVQAEATAFWVSQLIGGDKLDTSDYSFGYIGSWSKNHDCKELKENLNIIKSTAEEIYDRFTEKLSQKQTQTETQEASAPVMAAHCR